MNHDHETEERKHAQCHCLPTVADGMSPQGWSVCAKAMRSYDEVMVKDFKEELDTTLVFTGLLSAVITAFLIESYSMLKSNDTETMTRLLVEVAIRIGNSATPTGNPGLEALTPPPFEVTTAAIRINILWFLSLVLSLVTALFALLVKQWLRRYMSWTHVTRSRDSVTLRQCRYDALVQWQVFGMIGMLPLLIQVAVILFLVGVADLLWSLHTAVASVITVVIAVGLSLAIGSAILPTFVPTCPYRSPLAWSFSCSMTWIRKQFAGLRCALREHINVGRPREPEEEQSIHIDTWQENDLQFLERLTTSSRYERRSLAWSFRRFLDSDHLDALTHCLGDVARREDMVGCLFDVIARDLQRSPGTLREDVRRAHATGTKYAQRGGRNRHVANRHFFMTMVVLERLARTWEPSTLQDVLLLLRYLDVPSACVDASDTVARRLVGALQSVLTCRLELHPKPVGEEIQLVAAECLHDLCRRYFDEEQAGYSRCESWFSSADAARLLQNAVQIYNSPRATIRRLKGDPRPDRLFVLSASIALCALAQIKPLPSTPDIVFALRDLTHLLEEPIVRCTAERGHDPLITGWCRTLCALGDRDHALLPPHIIRVLAPWTRRSGDSRQTELMTRLLASHGLQDDAVSSMASTAEHHDAPRAIYADRTRVYRVHGGLCSTASWLDDSVYGSTTLPLHSAFPPYDNIVVRGNPSVLPR